MAKSKSGGTRSYLRGRIASDVYSIGRDANGKKQQVVRSLAETVKNPQTIAQMRGRMIMSTVMQFVSQASQIIDHSFDGVSNGQPSISEFIRQNYARIKADVAAHPATGNTFGLNKYQEKGAKAGYWVVSDGKLRDLGGISQLHYTFAQAIVDLNAVAYGVDPTVANLKELWGVGVDGFITPIAVANGGKVIFYRVSLADGLDDTTVITSENVKSLFVIDNPLGLTVDITFNENIIKIQSNSMSVSATIIGSKPTGNGGFEHNRAMMLGTAPFEFAADVALPTYPIGEERFLNGGEI